MLTSGTVSVFTSVVECSLIVGLDLSFFEKLILLKDQDFFFLRFFSADAGTSAVSSVGLLAELSAVVSKSPLVSETSGNATSVFSSSVFTGSFTSLAGDEASEIS